MHRRLGIAVIAAFGPMLLTACGDGGAGPGPDVSAPATASTGAPGSAAPSGPTYLGPDGYGALKLGMTRAEAEATGVITVTGEPPGGPTCGSFELKEFPSGANAAGGNFSAGLGIASIFAAEGMRTPEGIEIGSSEADLAKAYPDLQQGPNLSFVTVPGNPKAVYSFLVVDGRVEAFGLDLANQTCHN
ncbi:hypothetical protein GCM10010182_69400 [Actinomadura cremea]|nr:hypothetical protein GCM10010182_69400 [Actinomadura cremea]